MRVVSLVCSFVRARALVCLPCAAFASVHRVHRLCLWPRAGLPVCSHAYSLLASLARDSGTLQSKTVTTLSETLLAVAMSMRNAAKLCAVYKEAAA